MNELLSNPTAIFGAILAFGVVFMLISIFLGGVGDADAGAADVDFGADVDIGADADVGADGGDSQAVGISLNVIAIFCVGFGAMGLAGSLAEWPMLLVLLLSVLFGLLLGRGFQVFMRFLLRREPDALHSADTLIGKRARITVDTPAGKLGEALIIDGERIKYAVRHIEDAEPLEKGAIVSIVGINNGRLTVRRRNSE